MAYTILTEAIATTDRLLEVLTRKKIDKLLAPTETTLQNKVGRLFVKQGNAVVAQLTPLKKYLAESATSDFDDLFDSATLDTSADMQAAIDAAISNAIVSGGKSLLSDFKSDIVFKLTNPRAIAYTKDRAADAITGIDKYTKDDIKRLVTYAVENGTSYTTLAAQIKARYSQFAVGVPQKHIRSRAELVAITECGNAYQAGNLAAAYTMQDGGIKLQKYWLNSGDDRVSDGCKVNSDAGWIAINKTFPSGDDTPLRFPGCRCAAQYRRAV